MWIDGRWIDDANIHKQHAAAESFKVLSNEIGFDTFGIERREHSNGGSGGHESAAKA
jgi:hypothetical protein